MGWRQLMLETTFISRLTVDSVKRLQQDVNRDWQRLYKLATLAKVITTVTVPLTKAGESLAMVYSALAKSGVLEQIATRDMHLREEFADGLPENPHPNR